MFIDSISVIFLRRRSCRPPVGSLVTNDFTIFVISASLILANLAVDLLYGFLDPRVNGR